VENKTKAPDCPSQKKKKKTLGFEIHNMSRCVVGTIFMAFGTLPTKTFLYKLDEKIFSIYWPCLALLPWHGKDIVFRFVIEYIVA
jgi:hypothetical protein